MPTWHRADEDDLSEEINGETRLNEDSHLNREPAVQRFPKDSDFRLLGFRRLGFLLFEAPFTVKPRAKPNVAQKARSPSGPVAEGFPER
jgi:hypothetical protein